MELFSFTFLSFENFSFYCFFCLFSLNSPSLFTTYMFLICYMTIILKIPSYLWLFPFIVIFDNKFLQKDFILLNYNLWLSYGIHTLIAESCLCSSV